MFKPVDEIKPQYMYAVQPVKLFEPKDSELARTRSFELFKPLDGDAHNPFHPDVSNSYKGGRLDLLA